MAKRNYGIYYAIGKGLQKWLECCRGQDIEPLAALGAVLGSIGVIAISLIMFSAGVVIGLLVCVVALITMSALRWRI